MTTIFRQKQKADAAKCPTPTQQFSRRGQWYEKTPPGRPLGKELVLSKQFGRGAKTKKSDPYRYPGRYKEEI